jgi:hypothetical protein
MPANEEMRLKLSEYTSTRAVVRYCKEFKTWIVGPSTKFMNYFLFGQKPEIPRRHPVRTFVPHQQMHGAAAAQLAITIAPCYKTQCL